MVCKQCRNQLPEGAMFCSNCGCGVSNEPQVQVETPQAEIAETKTPKKENKFVRGLVSVICCVMIFIFSLATLSICVVRESIKEDNVEDFFEEVNIKQVINEDNMASFDDTMDYDYIVEIYEETSINELVTDVALEYTDYLLGGKKPHGVDADDIIEVMQKDSNKFAEILGGPLTELDFYDVEKFFEEEAYETLGPLSAEVRTNDALDITRIVISIYVIILLAALSLLFIFLLLKTRKFRLDSMVWTAVPLIVTSVIVGILGSVKPIVLALVGGVEPVVKSVLSVVMSSILSTVLISCGIVLLIGILLIVIYVCTKKIIAARANKK